MDVDIPEEIKEKLKIIEKEAGFSQRMKPPKKQLLVTVIYILVFVGGIAFAIHEKNVYQAGFLFLLGALYFITHFQNKEIYELHSNACDIINYYRSRENK